MDDLVAACDQLRDSNNRFYAFRVTGTFHTVKARVMKSVSEATTLKMAASRQQEFSFGELRGRWLACGRRRSRHRSVSRDTTSIFCRRIGKGEGTFSSAEPQISISKVAPSAKCMFPCPRPRNSLRRTLSRSSGRLVKR